MPNTMLFSLSLNTGLLVLIATLLTRVPIVHGMLLGDNNPIGSRAALAVIFGLVNIFSTYISVRAQGATVNTRVIGVLATRLLGGPYMGMSAAIIRGLRRYLFGIGGFAAVSYAVSIFVEGLIGPVFSRRFKVGKVDSTGVFLITALTGVGQMLIVILISKPFPAAPELVQLIAFPVIAMNALGMVVFIVTFNMVFMGEDGQFAEEMRLALGIVEQDLPHLREGFYNTRDMEATAEIICGSTAYATVMIADIQRILTIKGDARYNDSKEDAILKPTLDSIHNRKPTTFSYTEEPDPLYHVLKNHIIIAAPLIEMDKPIGSLTMVVRKHWHTSQSNLNFASKLAKPFSTQLELSDLDCQKRLWRKTGFKALQSRVSPHFLYNALNTIPYVCRENPERARELIRTLSSYYRQALENGQYMLSPHTELHHVSNYLKLEKVRFKEELQVITDVEEGINCMVPSFILQPLVENAVRYGTDKRRQRSVSINAHGVGNSVEITVTDKDSGFPMEAIKQLYSNEGRGSVGLKNVYRHLKSTYGEGNGLKTESSQDGSKVWFRVLMQPEPNREPLYS